MRTIQEIFDAVIASGVYRNADYSEKKYRDAGRCWSYFMCDCLWNASDEETITPEECKYAEGEISDYIRGRFDLESMLKHNKLPSSFNHRKALYQDWNNRPPLKDIFE